MFGDLVSEKDKENWEKNNSEVQRWAIAPVQELSQPELLCLAWGK